MIISQAPKFVSKKSRIKVTYPKEGITLNASSSCLIQWDRPGIQNVKAKIILIKPSSGQWKVIAEAASNTGKYSWIIPHDLQGGDYKIRVKAGKLANKSGLFTIKIPEFTINYPGGNEYLKIGEECVILWQAVNAKGVMAQLNLHIYQGNEWKVLATNIPADKGQYPWVVGKDHNGSNDIWDLATFPNYALKCRISISLHDSLTVYSSFTNDFFVKK
jgi:hypothetical protein